jgi:hypothetical protein
MLKRNTLWLVRLDGRVHNVRATIPNLGMSVHVDGVLAWSKKGILLLHPQEVCRFQEDDHEYVLSMKGYTWFFASLELRVDGREAERATDEQLADLTATPKTPAPQDSRDQRFELVETARMEQPLGEERKVIDNSRSSAVVQRRITMSKEWSQTITIDDETATAVKGKVGVKLKLVVDLKLEAERQVRERYSVSTETKKKYSDEVVITVPAKTSLEVIFAWKQVWQCGIIRVHAPDGSTVELPYRLCLEPTFDQRQVESRAQLHAEQ